MLKKLLLHSLGLCGELPGSIRKLTSLTKLDLGNNQLTHIPDSIGSMSSLRWLDVSNNKLTCLPDSIESLSRRTTLYLNNNPITSTEARKNEIKMRFKKSGLYISVL